MSLTMLASRSNTLNHRNEMKTETTLPASERVIDALQTSIDVLAHARHYYSGGHSLANFDMAIRQNEEAIQFVKSAVNHHAELLDCLRAMVEFSDNRTPLHPGALLFDEARALLARVNA